MKKQISNARMSSIGYFSEIVKENHKKLLRLNGQTESLRKELSKTRAGDKNLELSHKISIQEKEIVKTSFIVIMFSVIAIESYIYDYASRNLGDAFVKEHIDKLDPLSKWIIIPELITGTELNRNQHWFGLLKKMITTRNKITHYKAKDLTIENIQKFKNTSREVIEIALQSISLLNTLADKINEIDPEETPWVQSYLY